MIDEKKIIARFQKVVNEFIEKHPDEANGLEVKVINIFIELLQEEARDTDSWNNKWIPCSERVPDNDRYILLSFENYSVPCIGRYEEDKDGGAFYIGDEDEPLISHEIFVNAWMELPEMYSKDIEQNEIGVSKEIVSDDVCEWKEDAYGRWHTECNMLADNNPLEYTYCPYCRKKIKVVDDDK